MSIYTNSGKSILPKKYEEEYNYSFTRDFSLTRECILNADKVCDSISGNPQDFHFSSHCRFSVSWYMCATQTEYHYSYHHCNPSSAKINIIQDTVFLKIGILMNCAFKQ